MEISKTFNLFLTILGVLHMSYAGKRSLININNDNGYQDVLIAIHPDVAENSDIVAQLKAIYINASSYLYTATRQRSYFRNVSILIPPTWVDKPEYEDAILETLDRADYRVDLPNPLWGNNPYSKQTGQCGEPAEYSHLTPDYVLDTDGDRVWRWGDPGRVVVHEFGHVRYGVFDEYGNDNAGEHPFWYLNSRGRPEPTGCSAEIKGTPMHRVTFGRCGRDRATGLPEDDCRFFPDLTDAQPAISSVMNMQFLNPVHHFCETNASSNASLQHNKFAPNKQNKMCNEQGTWDVILQHEDFQPGNNEPRDISDVTPNIRVLYRRYKGVGGGEIGSSKPACKRIALVFDVSGSMGFKNPSGTSTRMSIFRQAAYKFIQTGLPSGTEMGLATFSTTGSIAQDMMFINNQTDRDYFTSKIPSTPNGWTAIGQGLERGMELLESGDTSDAMIILMTDGEENREPFVKDLLDKGRFNKDIPIFAIAYSDAADVVLDRLTQETGGMLFYYSQSDNSTALDDAFTRAAVAATSCAASDKPIEIQSCKILVTDGMDPIVKEIPIDGSVGDRTSFHFSYFVKSSVEVTLTSPSGVVYDKNSAEYNDDSNFKIITYTIPKSEAGIWLYNVTRLLPEAYIIGVNAKSHSAPGTVPVTATAWMNNVKLTFPQTAIIYAEVNQGYNPVVHAKVVATVERPEGDSVDVELFDAGIGADTSANDGVYSAYFTQFTKDGRYSLSILVTDPLGTAAIKTAGSSGSGAYNLRQDNIETVEEPIPYLQRQSSAGAVGVDKLPSAAGTEDIDLFPPNKVTDLKMTDFSEQNETVTLEWTAPGDDLNFGTVARFEVYMHDDFELLLDDQSEAFIVNEFYLLEGDLVPQPANSRHRIVIKLPRSGKDIVFAFVMRSWDDAGKASPYSNV
ncbi:unnamed protein product, partial [Owenia fusiformis]